MEKGIKQKYIGSAFFMLIATVIVKLIGAVYKIPLTSYIGATGRGYFSIAYNFCMPVHALTMGAFPIALTKLVSTYNAKGNTEKIIQLRRASKRLFFVVGIIGMIVLIVFAKPYANLIADSPKSLYTILALAPSVFFSCIGVAHRAFSEGFLDMKATAISQLTDALVKLIFGLLFARLTMSILYDGYLMDGKILETFVDNDEQALSLIYPISSAAAMLGTTFATIVAYVFSNCYTSINYRQYNVRSIECREAYNELLAFGAPLVLATVIQSISNFADTASVQYCLTLCDKSVLSSAYNTETNEICTYVYGIFATVLDFKNLVPAVVMALGITAVPAVSAAYESDTARFTRLINEIFKYTVLLSVLGGVGLALFSDNILSVFYQKSNPDIVLNASALLKYCGITILPCSVAVTSVYCTQALGFAKQTVLPFTIAAIVRVVLNFIFVSNSSINIAGTCLSNFCGFLLIIISNMITIHKKTNTKFSMLNIFFKPLIAGAVSFFSVNYAKNIVPKTENEIIDLVIMLIIFAVVYAILLIVLGLVNINNIKRLK